MLRTTENSATNLRTCRYVMWSPSSIAYAGYLLCIIILTLCIYDIYRLIYIYIYVKLDTSVDTSHNQSESKRLKTPNHLFLETPEDISFFWQPNQQTTTPTTTTPNPCCNQDTMKRNVPRHLPLYANMPSTVHKIFPWHPGSSVGVCNRWFRGVSPPVPGFFWLDLYQLLVQKMRVFKQICLLSKSST